MSKTFIRKRKTKKVPDYKTGMCNEKYADGSLVKPRLFRFSKSIITMLQPSRHHNRILKSAL